MPQGKTIEILAENLSPENRYIQAVSIAGRPWHSTTFSHEQIKDGAVIRFLMGKEPKDYTRA